MDYGNPEDGDLMELPRYDMLTIRFRADQHDVVVPYCEVANGDIQSLTDTTITVKPGLDKPELVTIPLGEFKALIEKSFDTKEIVKLAVQLAGQPETHKIL